MPNLCMAAELEGLAGSRSEMTHEIWLREEGFVQTTWKQLPLKTGSTHKEKSLAALFSGIRILKGKLCNG